MLQFTYLFKLKLYEKKKKHFFKQLEISIKRDNGNSNFKVSTLKTFYSTDLS